jgi:hypothetical protein
MSLLLEGDLMSYGSDIKAVFWYAGRFERTPGEELGTMSPLLAPTLSLT